MVANVSSTTVTPNPKVASRGPSPAKAKRAPLLPSEADNNGPSLPRRPKSRDVGSRYLSSTLSSASVTTTMTSTSSSSSFSSTTTSSSSNSMCTPRRRFPSPLVSSSNLMTPASTVNNKRAQSAERRRPGTPRAGEMSATAKMLTSTPARSLSVSFQGGSFALPVSKPSKPAPTASNNGSRQSTPERRAVTPTRKSGNSKPIDQQRWPGRSRQGSFMTRSVDFTNENMKLSGSVTASAVRALQKSMICETKLKPIKPEIPELNRSINKLVSDCDKSDRAVSDAESVSSGSTPGTIRGGTPRAVVVPARFRQGTVNHLRRVQPEPVSPPLSRNSKLPSGNRYLKDGPTLSPRGSSPSPVRGAVRPASPSKSVLLSSTSSPSRGMPSPTRARNGIGSNNNFVNTPSILSFAAEARRRKGGENAIVDAHVLRLLHNKYLQWRFANARADAAMLIQSATVQKSLYNAWVTTSKMRQSVISKQIEIQQLRQNLKLHSVLKNQIPCLKVWDQGERDHSVSLSGAIVSLESSTLRLPLVDGAKADVQNLKDAICSAVDVMQAMASSICSLVTKVEHVNGLASELASTTTNERCLIDGCKDLLSILTHMEMQNCSLRAHTLQLQRLPPHV
ncbi:QWRF motif-containing protein 2-like [Cynara cardunculus var. scolymus]|uniref:QWRF motif-containing protein 2-like n=1 Tax=Cynara cardunculus var. scolymus TaxID=59895 RepID=UPI000D627AC9|nr:QWRF motif-containing protein 2-like [Cynara cardunculus var. scolymus]